MTGQTVSAIALLRWPALLLREWSRRHGGSKTRTVFLHDRRRAPSGGMIGRAVTDVVRAGSSGPGRTTPTPSGTGSSTPNPPGFRRSPLNPLLRWRLAADEVPKADRATHLGDVASTCRTGTQASPPGRVVLRHCAACGKSHQAGARVGHARLQVLWPRPGPCRRSQRSSEHWQMPRHHPAASVASAM